ncbi:uncharacterized protein LOC107272075 [Cephus cinctus]|uniref:Uncharacterized protein LOC107272075 n=1 Tax=Cephus cinctus TaxID=211228 RepID=A0AAJ7C869_CEPCN|nr:uncharacterized protein LOC107272075 [Cephus cinctus]
MFALLQFTDNTYHICKSGDLSTQCVDGKHLYSLKYDKKKRHEARLVVYDESAILLNRMKKNLESNVHDKEIDTIKSQETSVEIGNLNASRHQPVQLENAAITDINGSQTHALLEAKLELSVDLGNGIETELTSFSVCKVENLNISGDSLTDDVHIATPLELSNDLDSSDNTYIISPMVGSKNDYLQLSYVSLHGDDHESSHIETLSKNSSANKLGTSNDLHVSLIEKGQTVPDDMNLEVEHSSQRSKRYFCCYCKKTQTKFARHLELIHSQEQEVQCFLQLPVNDFERKSIIAKLRKKSIHEFNTNSQYNTGELMVCRRPNEGLKKKSY